MRVIPLVDCGIATNATSPVYVNLLFSGRYIRNVHGRPLFGWVWPGHVIYPDFSAPDMTELWSSFLTDFYTDFPFGGIWLDMNEPTNFCHGECGRDENMDIMLDKYRVLPYVPGNRTLDNMTLSMDSRIWNGEEHFNVHNFYGPYQAKVTYKALKKDLGFALPFVLTRATFPGTGRYSAHWSGDISSDWDFLAVSVPSVLSFNMFGLPMTGADICGFYGNTTEYLCSRWIQSGALYPFARNHNHEKAIQQSFWSFGPTLLHTAVVCLRLRYALLKQYYTYFVKSRGVGMIVRPPFFEFPNESKLGRDEVLNTHFMLSDQLLFAPIVTNRSNFTVVYLPDGATWYDLLTGARFGRQNLLEERSLGIFVYNPLNMTPPAYLRGGAIICMQGVDYATKSTKYLNASFKVLVGLDEVDQGIARAQGEILTLGDYDERNIERNCVGDSDCIYKLSSIFKPNEHLFSLEFTPRTDATFTDFIMVEALTVYGFHAQGLQLDAASNVIAIAEIADTSWRKKVKAHIEVLDPIRLLGTMRVEGLRLRIRGAIKIIFRFG
eukprot:TRINITY_DN3064_c0_g2_i10.p1 TRINITY_DN3064_c0_g2~~TRINITY_DN3064_c0_g2_i10.p1  ORF type:complete len:550 (+),score=77.07 TRINITY_DN3064_c0_g2_i10:1341-2990(+)